MFSYGKLRGNWAKVGKDAPAYRFTTSYKNWELFPDGGWGVDATTAVANTLEPEMTSSWEIGADVSSTLALAWMWLGTLPLSTTRLYRCVCRRHQVLSSKLVTRVLSRTRVLSLHSVRTSSAIRTSTGL